MAGELFYPEELRDHLAQLLEWKNLTLTKVYGAEPFTMERVEKWLANSCEKIKPYLCDSGAYLKQAQSRGKSILFEAQLVPFGTWTSASTPTPPHLTPRRPTPLSVPACPPPKLTGW